jgi:hypothetical protein
MRRSFGKENRPPGQLDRIAMIEFRAEVLGHSQAAHYGVAAWPANLVQWDGRYLYGLWRMRAIVLGKGGSASELSDPYHSSQFVCGRRPQHREGSRMSRCIPCPHTHTHTHNRIRIRIRIRKYNQRSWGRIW